MARAAHVDMRSTITRSGQGVPVNFAPLLAPYRKHGRLALRIERLPQQARFSSGSRNNDGSWSLATDELEELAYHLPEGTRDHSLAIRIISLTGGNTLAVLDFPVTPGGAQPDAAPASASGAADDQVRALREQLAQMKTTLAERDAELAEARQAAEQAAPRTDTDGDLEAVRAELHAEFEERLAAVGAKAAADLKQQREAWTVELNTRVEALNALAQKQVAEAREAAQREAQKALLEAKQSSQTGEAETLTRAKSEWRAEETKRAAKAKSEWEAGEAERIAKAKSEWEAEEASRATKARSDWEAGEAKRIAKAKSEWEADEAKRAAKAKADWEATEADRLAQAKAEWQATAEKAMAEASVAQYKSHTAAIEALRTQLQSEARDALRKAEDEWKAAEGSGSNNARTQPQSTKDTAAELANLRTTLEREAKEALESERERWRNEEATRLTAAETKWRAETEKALATARAETAVQAATTDGAQKELQQKLASLQSMLAERDLALAEARSAKEKAEGEAQAAAKTARATLESDVAQRLADAHKKWQAEEAQRLSDAEKKWQGEEAKRIAAVEARVREQVLSEKPQLAAAVSNGDNQAELTHRIETLETMLADREAALAEAKEIIDQQSRSAKPARGAKREDAEWRAAAEAELRENYGNALNEARSRYEAAEAALAQVRIKNKDGGRTQQDLISTRAALAAREKELADLRAKFAPLDGQDQDGNPIETPAATAETSVKPQFSKGFIGAVIAIACVFAALIVFYPTIERAIFPPPPPPPTAAPEAKDAVRLEPVAVEQKAVLLRDAKLRADPSTTAKTVAAVTKGFEVVVVETRGKWSLVRMGSDPKAQQGWVQQSSLNDVAPTPPADAK